MGPRWGSWPATDQERSRRFFESVLGLELRESTPYALVLGTSGSLLRVTHVADFRPQEFTVFGWEVDDIVAAMQPLEAAGVAFLRHEGMAQDSRGIWTTPSGDRVSWFEDPDDNVLSLTERRVG